MRTAKYHDYIAWRILLFVVILLALGFLAFNYLLKPPCQHKATKEGTVNVEATCTEAGYFYKVCEICGEQFANKENPALGHEALEAVVENKKNHDETVGASYDLVVYCGICGDELSREKVLVGGAHTVVVVETKENVVDSTCTTEGSYELVKTCKNCDVEISRETKVIPKHEANIEVTEENHKDYTCTVDGGYEVVKTCKDCGYEVSRETVVLEAKHSDVLVDTKENSVDPTCTVDGGYDIVHSCSVCGEEISRTYQVVEAIGHDFKSWTIKYDSESKEFVINAVCKNEKDVVVITEADGMSVVRDETHPACCHNVYIVSYTYGDLVMTDKIEIPAVPHKVIYTGIVDGELKHDNTYDLPAPEVDEQYGEYYNVDVLPGIILYVSHEGEPNEWNEDGFARGAFKCATCGKFYIVTIYSAKYDTRVESENN